MRIAIIAALPGELKQFVDYDWRVSTKSKTISKWVYRGDDEWIAVCAGMGPEAAQRAFAEAESGGPLDAVLSVGWAGALGDAVWGWYIASAVVDSQTGERYELSNGERDSVLVSTDRVAQEPEKRRLAATYGAAMMDMESATIVRLAQMRGIPVCCIKSISDEVDDELPDFNLFIDNHGQMRMIPLLRYVAVRPRYWRPLLRLGRVSAKASHNIAHVLVNILIGPKDFNEINRTGNVYW